MKKFLCLSAVLFFASQLIFSQENVRKIIIDSDTAGDDCMAIMMAAKSPSVKILGVTVAAGNVELEQGMNNALMTLEVAGVDVPVFPGAETALDGIEHPCFSVYGKDGMGDLDLIHPLRKPETKPAVDFIIETINQNPHEIELVCLGPVTNIAKVYKKSPGTLKKVKKIWIMGTAGFGQGNATPVAEFNTYKDAEALQILFDAEVPLTIIGLNVCNVYFSVSQLDKFIKGTPAQSFTGKACTGLLQFNRQYNNLNALDLADQVAMSCVLWNDYVKSSVLCNATCIHDNSEAHGLAIFYQKGIAYDTIPKLGNPVVEVIKETKAEETYKRIFNLLK